MTITTSIFVLQKTSYLRNICSLLLCDKWIIFSEFSEYLDTITSKRGHSWLWISSHIRLNETHKWYHKSNCCVALMTRQQYNRFVNCALLAVDKDRIRRINQDTLHIHNACCHCSLRYSLSLRVSSAALQIILLTEYSWGGVVVHFAWFPFTLFSSWFALWTWQLSTISDVLLYATLTFITYQPSFHIFTHTHALIAQQRKWLFIMFAWVVAHSVLPISKQQ